MGNVINFEDARSKPVILSSDYILHWKKDYDLKEMRLTGDEWVTTTCPCCGNSFSMGLAEFCDIMGAGGCDLYGTMIYCATCSCKRGNDIGH